MTFFLSRITDNAALTKRSFNTSQLVSGVLIIMTLGTASGCASLNFSKLATKKPNQPTSLTKLANKQSIIQPILKTSTDSSIKSVSLDAVFDGQQMITASTKGQIQATATNGKKAWAVNLNEQITGGIGYDKRSNTLVVTTRNGKVVALDNRTGDYKWIQQLSGVVLAPALIVNNHVMLSGNNGVFYGLNLQTGQTVWQYSTTLPKISVRGTAKPVLLDNSQVLFATANGRLYAIESTSGKLVWSKRIGIGVGSSDVERMSDIDGTPVVDLSNVYVVSYSGQLVQMDKTNGTINYTQQIASTRHPVVTNDRVIITGLNGEITAFDKATGRQQWTSNRLKYRQLSNAVALPINANQTYLVVGDLEGYLHLFDSTTGKIVSREKTSGQVSRLQVVDGRLLSQTASGKVALWQF